MSERVNEIAPTIDMAVKVAVSWNKATRVGKGMVFLSSNQPLIDARIPFRYDIFSDEIEVPEDVNLPPWRGFIKALVRFHSHVFAEATDNLVERVDQLLAPEAPPLPPVPGPGSETSH